MEKVNKVHFYLTRDLNGLLTLWFSKPKREGDEWGSNWHSHSIPITYGAEISDFCLNYHDYDNLTWDDEPLEVFINCDNL